MHKEYGDDEITNSGLNIFLYFFALLIFMKNSGAFSLEVKKEKKKIQFISTLFIFITYDSVALLIIYLLFI